MNIKFGRLALSVNWLALVCVVIPTFLSVVYFWLLASNVYISESRFVVRAPDKPAATGLGIILKGLGFSNSGDELLATREYIMSRDALSALNANDAFGKAYSRANVFVLNRFDPMGLSGSFEDLYRYYGNKVTIEQDSTSGIAVLTVRAYTPEDAVTFNKRLLDLAEVRVNQMNERGRNDLVRYANREVEEAKTRSSQAATALARYRNEHRLSDPKEQGSVALQLISKLQDDLVTSRAQLDQLKAFTPQNPQIPVLENRVRTISQEIESETSKVAGSANSLAMASVGYQRLIMENQFADNQLNATMTSLAQARIDAAHQQAYVETIAQPVKPDSALEPRRVRGVFTTLVLGLLAWGISRMLLVR